MRKQYLSSVRVHIYKFTSNLRIIFLCLFLQKQKKKNKKKQGIPFSTYLS